MRAVAIPMILLMLSASFAGCTSGDPDGDDTSGIDMEILNQMIDDNLQDFINNTTIVVNNHYHNNTTNNVDSSDNSVSNYNGSGGVSDSTMYMFTVSWDRMDTLLPMNPYTDLMSISPNHSEMPDPQDSTLLYHRSYNGQMIEMRLTCMEYLSFSEFSTQNWEQWIEENYGYGPSGESNEVASSMNYWYVYGNFKSDFEDQCGISEDSWINSANWQPTSQETLFEVNLEMGTAMSIEVIPTYIDVDINCDDDFGTGLQGNGTNTQFIGGQANCLVTGSTQGLWEISSEGYVYDENGSRIREYNAYVFDWQVRYHDIAPADFAVYFILHDVEVYNLED